MECMKDTNKLSCKCTYNCSRKGICCQCVRYHRSRNEIPGCFFPKDAEKTYNRSIEYFIEVMKK